MTDGILIPGVLASAYLVLKLCLAWHAGRLIETRFGTREDGSFVAGWILVYGFQNLGIIVLSAFGLLTRDIFFGFWIVSLAIFVAAAPKARAIDRNFFSLGTFAWIPMWLVILAMSVRAFFLSDFTWDAQVYEVPRIILWLNHASVLIHMPTLQLNLFVNEWNAELNALAFSLISGSYVGFAFENVEILIVFFIGISWLARLLGASRRQAVLLATVLGTAPAILGLATTLKGDLLAIVAFTMAAAWLIELRKFQRIFDFAMLLLAATLAIGAKISVVLPTLVIVAAGLYCIDLVSVKRFYVAHKLAGAALLTGLLCFASRFVANLFIYGNPLRRIEVEKSNATFDHLSGNLQVAFHRMFEVPFLFEGDKSIWALAANMGFACWYIVGASVLGMFYWLIQRRHKHAYASSNLRVRDLQIYGRPLGLLVVAILIATLASMTLAEAYPWTFRYFAPSILVFMVGFATLTGRPVDSGFRGMVICSLAIVAIALNVYAVCREGEVIPAKTLDGLEHEIANATTPLQRASLFVKGPYQFANVDDLHLDSMQPLQILLFNQVDAAMLPFFGSHAQNDIRLVRDHAAFIAAAAASSFDVVAVLQKRSARDYTLPDVLESKGYSILVDNGDYLIAFPKRRVNLVPFAKLGDLKWSRWNADQGARIAVENGNPVIESERLVDTGLITQEFVSRAPVLVRAKFKGLIKGRGAHAAHISVHGVRPILELQDGSYEGTRTFTAIVPGSNSDKPFRLSFGLGGWAEGKGSLEMTELSLQQINLVSSSSSAKAGPDARQGPKAANLISVFLAILLVLLCIAGGSVILTFVGFEGASLLGSALLTGYALLGLLLLFSNRYLGTLAPGLIAYVAAFMYLGHQRYADCRKAGMCSSATEWLTTLLRARLRNTWIRDPLLAVMIVSWVGLIGLTYYPLLRGGVQDGLSLPAIFDLPKHLFAIRALTDAESWPIPNPFFRGELFTYNFVFYYPLVLVSKLLSDGAAIFQMFAIEVLLVAFMLPLVMLDICKKIAPTKITVRVAVLFATWAGGITPLLVKGVPAIGYMLFAEHYLTRPMWVDELFVSVIFVPQHVFGVLSAAFAITVLCSCSIGRIKASALFISSFLLVSAALSSLILIPHVAVSGAIGLLIAFLYRRRTSVLGSDHQPLGLTHFVAIAVPILLGTPFLLEVLGWSGNAGVLAAMPKIDREWWYAIEGFGLVVPFALLGVFTILPSRRGLASRAINSKVLLSMTGMAAIGAAGMVFGAYPDAGIKSGLWLRIMLVPLGCIGFSKLLSTWSVIYARTSLIAGFMILGTALAALNMSSHWYFAKSGLVTLDPGTENLVKQVRGLPMSQRVALLSSDQVLAALFGRQVDFDFSPLREDSYMPADGRVRARNFWVGISEGDVEAWRKAFVRYDVLITPVNSPSYRFLSERFGQVPAVGGYAVYKVKAANVSPESHRTVENAAPILAGSTK